MVNERLVGHISISGSNKLPQLHISVWRVWRVRQLYQPRYCRSPHQRGMRNRSLFPAVRPVASASFMLYGLVQPCRKYSEKPEDPLEPGASEHAPKCNGAHQPPHLTPTSFNVQRCMGIRRLSRHSSAGSTLLTLASVHSCRLFNMRSAQQSCPSGWVSRAQTGCLGDLSKD
jgi:hypothetical protein